MRDQALPRLYGSWRQGADRQEDAAAMFLHFVSKYCRDEAIRSIGDAASPETLRATTEAVDRALHAAMALLEGFWPLPAGDGVSLEFAVQVNVLLGERLVESVAIAPARTDLPIGYWGFVSGGDG